MDPLANKTIVFHPFVAQLLDEWIAKHGQSPTVIKAGIAVNVAKLHPQAKVHREPHGLTPTVWEIDVHELTFFYTVESDYVVIRGLGRKALADEPDHPGPHMFIVDDIEEGDDTLH